MTEISGAVKSSELVCLTMFACRVVPYCTSCLMSWLLKNSVPKKVTLIVSTANLVDTNSGFEKYSYISRYCSSNDSSSQVKSSSSDAPSS